MKPTIYFDSFGPVNHVLHEIDERVPFVFENAHEFIEQLKKNVVEYATTNGWDIIALSLSKGLARADLNELLDSEAPHDGPIMVDPTGSTPEHQIYNHYNEIKACRERLVRVNETSGDVMIIMYGLSQIGNEVSLNLLMRRLRIINGILDMTEDEWKVVEQMEARLGLNARRAMVMARDLLGIIIGSLPAAELANYVDKEGNRVKYQLTALYAILQELKTYALSPAAQQTLAALLASIGAMPNNFNQLGLDWGPIQRLSPQVARPSFDPN